MNVTIVLLCCLLGLARSQEYFREPEKLVSESRSAGDAVGDYAFAYETEGGILQRESGSRKYAGTANEAQLIQGSVQYNAPDGTPVAISWTADEFGTQVSGTHLPTPPPIPPAIQRALEWLAKQPSTTERPEGGSSGSFEKDFAPQSPNSVGSPKNPQLHRTSPKKLVQVQQQRLNF